MSLKHITKMTHLHVYRQQRDCDGLYDSSVVIAPPTGLLNYWMWAVSNASRPWNTNESIVRDNTEDGCHRLTYWGRTDEGFLSEELIACDDESCDLGDRYYRDHTAESMGY